MGAGGYRGREGNGELEKTSVSQERTVPRGAAQELGTGFLGTEPHQRPGTRAARYRDKLSGNHLLHCGFPLWHWVPKCNDDLTSESGRSKRTPAV